MSDTHVTAPMTAHKGSRSRLWKIIQSAAIIGVIAFIIFDGPGRVIDLFSSHAKNATEDVGSVSDQNTFHLTENQITSAHIKTATAGVSPWMDVIRVTGSLAVNEDRVAHIHPISPGVVRNVDVAFGDNVKTGQLLATIDSPAVGTAKLELVQNELKLKAAQTKLDWQRTINKNVQEFITRILTDPDPVKLVEEFSDRPMGDYRQQLMGAYTRRRMAEVDVARLSELANQVVANKELIRAKSEVEASNAVFQSLAEQIKFDAQQQLLLAEQQVAEAKTSVGVSKSRLYVLGYTLQEVESMNPLQEGQKLSYFPIKAPLDGTILQKDIVLDEQVETSFFLFKIADLSTVWLKASVFEKDLGLIHGLVGKDIVFRAASYPGRTFTAKVASMGNVVDETTRALPLLAVAENKEGVLKPGMFVEVEIPASDAADVLSVSNAAIVENAGQSYVFVQTGPTTFERRTVEVGRRQSDRAEILKGLKAGDEVVMEGAFALKSEMLRSLLSEE